MNDPLKHTLHTALTAVVLLLSGCRAAPSSPTACGDRDYATLCVMVDEEAVQIERLASTNVLEAQTSSRLDNDTLVNGLIEVPLTAQPLELILSPAATLQVTEVDVYDSLESLTVGPPGLSAECAEVCGSRYFKTAIHALTVQLPRNELSNGNIVVIRTFVERPPQEVGTVSWGIVLHEQAP